jgi:type IV fimbrial biogenesis protein FimT
MLNPSRARSSGLTLVETLVTLAVGSIVLAVGIPALAGLVAGNRITSELNTLTTHLHLARSEAMKRGLRAVICPTRDGATCLGSQDWGQGYMLFADFDADRERDPDETVLQVHRVDGGQIRIDSGGRRTIAYQADGFARGSNLTVTFCDAAGRADPKAVVVSATGRPRVADIHPNGDPLSCG